jgi:hypothetical protein
MAGNVFRAFLAAAGALPLCFWISLAVLLVLETLAVVGSVYYSASVRQGTIDSATSIALDSATALEKLLDSSQAPIFAFASYITVVRSSFAPPVHLPYICGGRLLDDLSA